ncbi:diguanylate cyclase domain-containing protein [Paenibacillus turpanensis]|uniref:diguanylate cyclase domain-containing protein n=1 Tax=Paenibacillus turpanensis TaxID=2689078 RepID=UPI00140E07A4|nr:diguanylate cyclase [Paenibacillus turpanensis]
MNDLFMDFLTILLPTYFFFYMAITIFSRNKKSPLNRVAGLLMLSFLFYFLGEYLKTSLLPQYQVQIVLYGNGPMLLLIICFLVHLCILVGSPVTRRLQRWLPLIYAAPFIKLFILLASMEHHVLYNAEVTGGRSPLHPLMLVLTLSYVAGYIFLSVAILAVSWFRTKETKRRRLLRSLLLSLFGLFTWFVFVTFLLQAAFLDTRNAMMLYFIGYLVWGFVLRHIVGKYDFLPDYRKLFQILFQSAPTSILLLNQEGRVIEMNPRAKVLFEGFSGSDANALCHLYMNEGVSLKGKLASFLQDRSMDTSWEVQMNHPNAGRLDLIASLDVIQEADEELLVVHLTNVTSLKETERRLLESERSYKYLAHHDPLTGLYNRAAIQELLEGKIHREEPFAFILIDLDNFKPINDTYGHLVGDRYLQHIAEVLRKHAGSNDLLGRIGGDEFVLILPSSNDTATVEKEASHRLLPFTEHPLIHNEAELSISFSAGISLYPRHASDLTALLRKADEAMYAVKRGSKNGIAVYDGD